MSVNLTYSQDYVSSLAFTEEDDNKELPADIVSAIEEFASTLKQAINSTALDLYRDSKSTVYRSSNASTVEYFKKQIATQDAIIGKNNIELKLSIERFSRNLLKASCKKVIALNSIKHYATETLKKERIREQCKLITKNANEEAKVLLNKAREERLRLSIKHQ